MLKEFIKKSIETDSGFPATCWVVTEIWINIKENFGIVTLIGYKDFEAMEAGRHGMGSKQIKIADLSMMGSYTLVQEDIINATFLSPDFDGATLETQD